MPTIPTALIAFVPGIVELLVLRTLQGLLIPGLLTVATAYIYEAFPARRVPTVVGVYTSALVLGGFLGRTIPALGAIVGAIAGGGTGAAIGAASGAAVGGAATVLTNGPQVKIPSETRLSFRLQAPVQL